MRILVYAACFGGGAPVLEQLGPLGHQALEVRQIALPYKAAAEHLPVP